MTPRDGDHEENDDDLENHISFDDAGDFDRNQLLETNCVQNDETTDVLDCWDERACFATSRRLS
jgi:hypothetical protein